MVRKCSAAQLKALREGRLKLAQSILRKEGSTNARFRKRKGRKTRK